MYNIYIYMYMYIYIYIYIYICTSAKFQVSSASRTDWEEQSGR